VRTVEQLVSHFGKAARIGRPVTPHLLRHSCATEMTDLGTGLKAVQTICGHSSQATTERYIHVRVGAERVRSTPSMRRSSVASSHAAGSGPRRPRTSRNKDYKTLQDVSLPRWSPDPDGQGGDQPAQAVTLQQPDRVADGGAEQEACEPIHALSSTIP